MKITVEMSLYPLATEFLPVIKKTVERLNSAGNVIVRTNATSTQITGEFSEVMALVQEEIRLTFEETGKAIFVCKFLNGELNILEN